MDIGFNGDIDNSNSTRDSPVKEPVYSTFEISKFCSADITTVKGWIDDGLLAAYRTPGGHRRVLRGELIEFLQKYHMPVSAELRGEGRKVLLVDDEPAVLRLLTKILGRLGESLEIRTADNGFAAGRELERFLPELVVLDLHLPGVDGFSVCGDIRKTHGTGRIKILAITGYGGQETRDRIMACGADDYVEKPFDDEQMARKLAKLLGIPAPGAAR